MRIWSWVEPDGGNSYFGVVRTPQTYKVIRLSGE